MDNHVLEVLEYPAIINKILGYCAFSGGQDVIKELPVSNSSLWIENQLRNTRCALEATNRFGSMPFSGIRDFRGACNYAKRGGIIGIDDLLSISIANSGIKQVISYYDSLDFDKQPLEEYVSSLVTYDKLEKDINSCISDDGRILDSASSTLASIRRKLKDTAKSLDYATKKYLNEHKNDLVDSIISSRNDRQVIIAKTTLKNTIDGIQYGSTNSNTGVYLEPSELIPFNNLLSSLRQDEADEIAKILQGLSNKVAREADQLIANIETLSYLDALFAKAQFGRSVDGCVATLSKDNDLIIQKGYHPLLDKKTAIRNTYQLISPYRSLLITGPNTGGKSVTLKTIGLFILLTYSGIPVSCQEASIPLFDQMFVDIGDNQSISESLSTFSASMKVLSNIFEKATSNSLVIIDELCSGTDPKEGENLAISILEYFREKNIYFIGSTHYSKLKQYAKENDDILVASLAFDMDTLSPTYRFLQGIVGQSNGIEIAARYGLPESITKMARKLRKEDTTVQEELIEKLSRQQEEYENLTLKAKDELEALEKSRSEYEINNEKLENQKENILMQAKEKADKLINDKLEEALEIIEELKSMNEYDMSKTISLRKKMSDLIEEDDESEDGDDSLKEGDFVKIIKSNQYGKIISINSKEAVINVNGLTVRTKPVGLKKEKKIPEVRKKREVREYHPVSLSPEINLIGMRVAEAMPVLDKYLDDAVRYHLTFVRVIHGFGTGQLRKAVWDLLKKNKCIERYELADGQNGGAGATMVYFR